MNGYSHRNHRVIHEYLVRELHSVGIQGDALRWFSNYLSDRKQRVCVNSKVSPFISCTRGVPHAGQRPRTFAVHTLHQADWGCTTIMYVCHQEFADDILLDCAGQNLTEIANSLSVAITNYSYLTCHSATPVFLKAGEKLQ